MTVLYHSPLTRSSAVAVLAQEIGAGIEIREVTVARIDGAGQPDPRNPHPEKKVPYLVDGDEALRERAAIMLYLTDRYPEAGMGIAQGEAGRGAYLSWLAYYQGVLEPVVLMRFANVDHPAFVAALGDYDRMIGTLETALAQSDWLAGGRYTAADILCSSAFTWAPGLVPEGSRIADWVRRCTERPAARAVQAADRAAMAA